MTASERISGFTDRLLAWLNSPAGDAAAEAGRNYTRQSMYRLTHIPTRWLVPPEQGHEARQTEERRKLVAELCDKGYIDLDSKGEPACLSGRPPALDKNGKWQNEPGRVTDDAPGK